jgi:hypothetical protein
LRFGTGDIKVLVDNMIVLLPDSLRELVPSDTTQCDSVNAVLVSV